MQGPENGPVRGWPVAGTRKQLVLASRTRDLHSLWDLPLTSQVTLDQLHPFPSPCFLAWKVRGLG